MWKWLRSVLFLSCLTLTSCAVNQRRAGTYIPLHIPPAQTLYDSITFDIVSEDGIQPDKEELQFFASKLREYHISHVIHFRYRENINSPNVIWTSASIRQFEKDNRVLHDKDLKDRDFVVFIAYVNGNYVNGETTNVAGLQYGRSSFALFADFYHNEGVVLLHEFGHILRLAHSSKRKEPPVNPDRPNHCNNTSCTMFWRAGKTRIRLDSQCRQELNALIAAAQK
jgi:hypothetical protein